MIRVEEGEKERLKRAVDDTVLDTSPGSFTVYGLTIGPSRNRTNSLSEIWSTGSDQEDRSSDIVWIAEVYNITTGNSRGESIGT